ncbi:hypothetical protein AVEN_201139-1 [Araneus ventricosus]|uniref:Uncharacterized protein n=1 Tax=Araneus ventricosus TaxID=182803 RepID=A0A4Y2IJ85_ARAVE|nr:hypothetical protein AVEN_201139-1 [Araneus ventricosus]
MPTTIGHVFQIVKERKVNKFKRDATYEGRTDLHYSVVWERFHLHIAPTFNATHRKKIIHDTVQNLSRNSRKKAPSPMKADLEDPKRRQMKLTFIQRDKENVDLLSNYRRHSDISNFIHRKNWYAWLIKSMESAGAKTKRKQDASEFDVAASENDEENLEDEDEEDEANSNNGQIIQEKRPCTSLEIQKL